MRIVPEPFEKLSKVLVHVGVERDLVHELIVFLLGRKLAVTEQPRDLEERRVLCELLDGITPVAAVLIFLSSVARIAPSATGTLYDLLVRVSFISSPPAPLDDEAEEEGFEEAVVVATSGLALFLSGLELFFLAVARGAVEPVFGILFSS
jgi:hypothetical protein